MSHQTRSYRVGLLLIALFSVASAHAGSALLGTSEPLEVVESRECSQAEGLSCSAGLVHRNAFPIRTTSGAVRILAVPSLPAGVTSFEARLGGKTIGLREVRRDRALDLDVFAPATAADLAIFSSFPEVVLKSDLKPGVALGTDLLSGRGEFKLLNPRSDRTFIPLLPLAMEVLNTNAVSFREVVGRPLFTSAGEWVGAFTAERLRLRASQATQLVRLSEVTTPFGGPFVLYSGADLIAAAEQSESKAAEILRIGSSCARMGGAIFCEVCDSKPEEEAPSSSNFPIGGANGNGIGGSLTSGRRCKIQFRDATGPAPSAPSSSTAAKYVADVTKGGATFRNEFEAWYTVDSMGSPYALSSLAEFLKTLYAGSSSVVTVRVSASSLPAGTEKRVTYDLAEDFALKAFARLTDKDSSDSSQISLFIGRVSYLARVAQSEGVSPEMLALFDEVAQNASVWYLIELGSPTGVVMHKSFLEFHARLRGL